MLFGAHPEDTFDTIMQVTFAYNHFRTGLTQRMPRYLTLSLLLLITPNFFEWEQVSNIDVGVAGADLVTFMSSTMIMWSGKCMPSGVVKTLPF